MCRAGREPASLTLEEAVALLAEREAKPAARRPATSPAAGLPDRETLLAFLRDAGETEKADIAKAFGLKGADRRALREMLRGWRPRARSAGAAARASPKPAPCPRSAWSTWSKSDATAT
jgi:hypothetical protein